MKLKILLVRKMVTSLSLFFSIAMIVNAVEQAPEESPPSENNNRTQRSLELSRELAFEALQETVLTEARRLIKQRDQAIRERDLLKNALKRERAQEAQNKEVEESELYEFLLAQMREAERLFNQTKATYVLEIQKAQEAQAKALVVRGQAEKERASADHARAVAEAERLQLETLLIELQTRYTKLQGDYEAALALHQEQNGVIKTLEREFEYLREIKKERDEAFLRDLELPYTQLSEGSSSRLASSHSASSQSVSSSPPSSYPQITHHQTMPVKLTERAQSLPVVHQRNSGTVASPVVQTKKFWEQRIQRSEGEKYATQDFLSTAPPTSSLPMVPTTQPNLIGETDEYEFGLDFMQSGFEESVDMDITTRIREALPKLFEGAVCSEDIIRILKAKISKEELE